MWRAGFRRGTALFLPDFPGLDFVGAVFFGFDAFFARVRALDVTRACFDLRDLEAVALGAMALDFEAGLGAAAFAYPSHGLQLAAEPSRVPPRAARLWLTSPVSVRKTITPF